MPGDLNGPDEADDFETIYMRHYRSVYRYLLGLTGSPAEAEDVAADAFERAYRAWLSTPPPPGRELPWLLVTARRRATDRWRRAKRFATLRQAARGPRPEAGHERAEFWLWFDALSSALSTRQREVLLLRYERDLSDEDIGAVMGLSPSGVRSLVSRALEALRRHPELLS